jgi:hypothetical protein
LPTGTITPLELRNRVWELDVTVMPHAETTKPIEIEEKDLEPKRLCPFQGQARRP